MADKNKNGIDDAVEIQYAKDVELAKELGVEPPPPPTPEGVDDSSAETVATIFAGEERVPLYDSGIGRESVGRIPIEQTKQEALDQFGAMDEADISRLKRIAESIGVDTQFSSLQWLWQQGVNNAEAAYGSGKRVSVWDYLESWAEDPEQRTAASAGVGAAYSGPRKTYAVQSEADVRELADTVAMEMIGRGISDDEMAKILKKVRKAEMAQPTVSTTTPGSTTTEYGLTPTGRQDIIENIIAKKPEYAEFQKATTLMSWFDRALSERLQA